MRFVAYRLALRRVFLRLFRVLRANTISQTLCTLSTCCSYLKRKRESPGSLPKSSALVEIGEHFIVKYTRVLWEMVHVYIENHKKTISTQDEQNLYFLTVRGNGL